MKNIFLSLFIVVQFLSASIFDFQILNEAKKAYESGDYEKSAKLYKKIAEDGKDEAKFNAADALYKAEKFQEALKLFKSISSDNLQFKKLHNIGNCYAKLKKFDDAISMYEKALKIKEDKDTRFNLELLKELNKKKDKDKKSKQNSNKNQSSNQRDNKNQSSKNKNQKKKSNSKKDRVQQSNQNMVKTDEPISDMEVRKWNKVLNQRGIHTLMLPLQTNTKGTEDEKHPW